jgi:hypothetical protein
MRRFLAVTFWIFSAVAAVAFAVLFGFYGWAAILVWSVLVLPAAVSLREHQRDWPSPTVVRLWILAVSLNLAAGILPPVFSRVFSSSRLAEVVGWLLVVLIWSGAVAAILVIASVTATAIRRASTHHARAA